MTVVIIIGRHYAGTSAVAGAVHILGFPVDQGENRGNEDRTVHKIKHDRVRMKQYLDERRGEDYGFKIPRLTPEELAWYREQLGDELRIICVFRDPVALATSHNNTPPPNRLRDLCGGILNLYKEWVEGVPEFLPVSFERLKENPEMTVQYIADYCGAELTEEKMRLIKEYTGQRMYESVNAWLKKQE